MKLLSQRNPEWADKKMGASNLTLGRFGCTTTGISMLSDYFECYKSPVELASDANHYTKDGLVLWQNFHFDRMRFVRREFGHNSFNIEHAINTHGKAVLLQVNNGAHWVVATKKTRNDYQIADPWDGELKACLATYHNITGAAYFEDKALEEVSEPIDPKYGKTLGARDYPFFIQADAHGELWYIHPDGEREYLSPLNITSFIQKHAVGITTDDLEKVKIK